MLRDAREELQATHKRHEQELKTMQSQLHVKSDESFRKFKSAVQDSLTKPTGGDVPTNNQVDMDFCAVTIIIFIRQSCKVGH